MISTSLLSGGWRRWMILAKRGLRDGWIQIHHYWETESTDEKFHVASDGHAFGYTKRWVPRGKWIINLHIYQCLRAVNLFRADTWPQICARGSFCRIFWSEFIADTFFIGITTDVCSLQSSKPRRYFFCYGIIGSQSLCTITCLRVGATWKQHQEFTFRTWKQWWRQIIFGWFFEY